MSNVLIEKLQKLADHLYSLDSDSGEAHLISEALMELRSRSEILVKDILETIYKILLENQNFNPLAMADKVVKAIRPYLYTPKREQSEILDNNDPGCTQCKHPFDGHYKHCKWYQKRESVDHRILVGGNHLASSLLQKWPPTEIKDYDTALTRCGQPYADMWCCWKAIMDVRDGVNPTGIEGQS